MMGMLRLRRHVGEWRAVVVLERGVLASGVFMMVCGDVGKHVKLTSTGIAKSHWKDPRQEVCDCESLTTLFRIAIDLPPA